MKWAFTESEKKRHQIEGFTEPFFKLKLKIKRLLIVFKKGELKYLGELINLWDIYKK